MNDILNGRFSIMEVISENRLYKAVDIATGDMVAIKKWDRGDEFFKSELEALHLLQHPCMPRLICSFENEECHFIAEEWIDGIPLTNSNAQTYFILDLVESTTQFISYIANKPYELIHGDIKPSNLLLRDNKIYFLDFESCMSLKDQNRKVRDKTMQISDEIFYAPEVLQGNPCMQSDIYSIGVIFAWLLGGIIENRVVLSQISTDIKVKTIIKKCIANDPKERYQTAEDLLLAINDAKNGSNIDILTPNTVLKIKSKVVFSVFVDCNVCFAWELANTASECFGMKTGIFALTQRTQRKLNYYVSESYEYGEISAVCEEISPYILDIKPLFKSSIEEWISKGYINKVDIQKGNLYCSSLRLTDELQPDQVECTKDLDKWAKMNFDLAILVTDRYDDKLIVKNLSVCSDCIIATPLADVDDIDACRNYYEKFDNSVLYAAWEYNERSSLPEESIKMIVGFDKYLGYINHSDGRNYKRNFAGKIHPIFQDEQSNSNLQYIDIINKLFSFVSEKPER